MIAHPTGAGVPHKVQVQAATVAGLGESRVVEEVLFSEEQGIHYICAENSHYSGGTCVPIQSFYILIYNVIIFIIYIYL